MQHLNEAAEAATHACRRLRCERDLRYEDDHAAPLTQRMGSGTQEDLGLARTCDAVQEQLATVAVIPIDRPLETSDCRKLVEIRLERRLELRLGRGYLDEPSISEELAHRSRSRTRACRNVCQWARCVGCGSQNRCLAPALRLRAFCSGKPRVGWWWCAARWQDKFESPRRGRGIAFGDP